MRKVFGWALFFAGAWMLVSPQARIGWTFSGEVLAGAAVLSLAYYLVVRPSGRAGL